MNKSPFDYGRPSQLARLPPATSRWLARMGEKNKRGARLRLDKRVVPPTFTIASPGTVRARRRREGRRQRLDFTIGERKKTPIFSHQELYP